MSTSLRLSTGFALCLAFLIAIPTNCCAEDQADAATGQVELAIPANATVHDVIRQATSILGLQIITSREKMLSRPIEGTPVMTGTKSQVLSQLRSLLMTFEMVLTRIGSPGSGMYRALDMRQSSLVGMRAEPVELNELNLKSLESEPWRYVTTSISVHNQGGDLRNLRTALSKMVTGSNIGKITENPEAGAFVITDFAPRVVSAYRLVQQLDVERSGPRMGYRVSVVRLGNAKAKTLEALISGLYVSAQPSPGKGQRAPVATRVVADERTNQLVLSGEAEAVAQIEAMVHRLDVDLPDSATQPVTSPKVTEIKYLRAADVTDMLNELAHTKGARAFDTRPTVVFIAARNAVLVVGTEHTHKVVASLIARVDVPATNNSDD